MSPVAAPTGLPQFAERQCLTIRHGTHAFPRCFKSARTCRFQPVLLTAPATTLGRTFFHTGCNEASPFEPVHGRVDRAR